MSAFRRFIFIWILAAVLPLQGHDLPPARIMPRKIPLITPALRIPAVDIEQTVTPFDLDGTSWAIDPWERQIGHLQGTAWTYSAGNIVLAGHAEYPDGSDGVFATLIDLEIGDEIELTDETGRRHAFTVSEVRTVDYDDLTVVLPTATRRLTLITCDTPTYDASRRKYARRVVVIAEAR